MAQKSIDDLIRKPKVGNNCITRWWYAFWEARREKRWKANLQKLIAQKKSRENRPSGVIFTRECGCGNYKPRSVAGIIDSSCRNCGGARPNRVFT